MWPLVGAGAAYLVTSPQDSLIDSGSPAIRIYLKQAWEMFRKTKGGLLMRLNSFFFFFTGPLNWNVIKHMQMGSMISFLFTKELVESLYLGGWLEWWFLVCWQQPGFWRPALCVSSSLAVFRHILMWGGHCDTCWQTFPALSIMFQFGVGAQCNHESKAQDFPSLQYVLQNTVQELNP